MSRDQTTRSWADGEVIFEAGDIGTESYQILKGQVSVLIGYGPVSLRKEACKLGVGSFFGSMALQSVSRVRTATCIAIGATVLQIVDRLPTKIAVPSLTSLLAKEQHPDKKSEEKKYKQGDFIVKQGDPAHNTYYVLVRGCLTVIVDSKTVGTMTESGTVFGESCALSEDNVRTASVAVKSASGATVLVMNYEAGNPGLRSMLRRRREEILFRNCQTERSKSSSSSLLLNLRSSIATARPSTLKSNDTNNTSTSSTRWNLLRKKFGKSEKKGAEESLRHVEQKRSKWNLLRRMVVQTDTSIGLVHSCTSRIDLTETAKINLLDHEAAESGKKVLAERDRKNQEEHLQGQDKKTEEKHVQKEKEKETIDHQEAKNDMNIVRLDLPVVVEPRRDAVHEQVKTDEGRFIVDAKEQERMWEEIIKRKAMGEKDIVAKPPTNTNIQKKQKKQKKKQTQKVFVPVAPKKETKSIVVTKRKKKKLPSLVKVVKVDKIVPKKQVHVPVRVEVKAPTTVVEVEATPKVQVVVVEEVQVPIEAPRTLRLSVTAADVKRSIEAYRKAIHLRSETF